MKLIKIYLIVLIIFSCINLNIQLVEANQIKWYKSYELGQKAMEIGDWNTAANYFKDALKVKNKDKNKTRASGTIFISYYPHRDLGICYYHLGKMDLARQELSTSLSQARTLKAKQYLNKIKSGVAPQISDQPKTVMNTQPGTVTETQPEKIKPDIPVETSTPVEVGERLRIAILPFENKGTSQGIDLLDKFITVFVNMDRFKVLERAQLERVLEELKLGMSGFIDASTAAEIGKGIGVDAVVTGSITWTRNDISIDARFIDTETATIITAQDAYSSSNDLKSLNRMLEELATKFKNDLPVVNGYIISVSGDKLTLDLGKKKGIKKGMKCYAYREGAPIIHPITKKVIGKMIDVLSEVQLREVYEQYSIGYIVKHRDGTPSIGDMVITK